MSQKLTRHVGRTNNTGVRVIVVFRTIPNDEDYCLVVEADHLPDMYADNMNTIVHSTEAQSTVELSEVLHRRTFSDGSPVLQTLHERGFLKKMPVSQIEMLPMPGAAVQLSIINAEIGGAKPAVVENTTEVVQEPQDPKEAAKFKLARANELRIEADVLAEQAYILDPSLRPAVNAALKTDEEKALTKERRNARRRERNAAKKAPAAK